MEFTFEMKEGTYVAAVWMIPLRDARDMKGQRFDVADWFATLYKHAGDEWFTLVYRFRYYKDDKVYDSEDERSDYVVKFVGKTEAEAMEITAACADTIAKTNPRGAPIHKLVLRSKDPRFIYERMSAEEFIHMRPLREEEQDR